MGFKSKYNFNVDFEVPQKLNWYYAPLFGAFWLVLYLTVVVTEVQHLPMALDRKHEEKYPNRFIAERAHILLENLSAIGPKVVGSVANEVTAVEFLKNEIAKIQQQAIDYFQFEVDVQEASGSYIHWTMLNMYQSIQNVVVKLSSMNSTSSNYLLINSHYDSVSGSPGAGDDGAMVAVMLESLRVLAKSQEPLKHPIVFLFNGAEENPLQASHAFITQHKWAKNCKALINMDASGSGGRELLFQSGPNNPWLMKYYQKVPHPFAITVAEEMFQAGYIPSDTDFRIFRDYGAVPGLDLAYVFNGYFYHTENDRVQYVSKESLQNTGDNLLVLAKAIGNAAEMDDPENPNYTEGYVVFYDLLGWFMVFYAASTAAIVNVVVCIAALCAIAVSLFFMSARSGLSWLAILKRYGISFALQVISVCFAAGLTMLVALLLDGIGRPMSWYSENWLVIGLFYCPMLFGMGFFPSLYVEKTKEAPLSLGFRIQLFMHSHCLILILLTLSLTVMGIRSSYTFMMAIFFDTAALIINLISKWHRKAYWFAIAVMICQILPFLYFTSLAHILCLTFIPMTGRADADAASDIFIGATAICISLLFAGVIMPLFLFFHKARAIVCVFLFLTLLAIIIALTPVGFPYRSKISMQRFNLLHAQRTLHDANGNVRLNESGIYYLPQDRKVNTIDSLITDVVGEKRKVSDYCDKEMFCGMPLYNHRWNKARNTSFWIPIDEFPLLPTAKPTLDLKSIANLEILTQKRFEFELSGPDHMTIFIDLKGDAKLIDWSFNDLMIREKWEKPYFLYFSYGKDSRPLNFTIDVEVQSLRKNTSEGFNIPSLEIGIGGHWLHQETQRTPKYQKLLDGIPRYVTVSQWVASYESWLF